MRVADLTVNTFVLDDLTFQNCHLIGPAVIVPQGITSFLHCRWDAPSLDALFWEVPAARSQIVGAIVVLNCTFSACTLSLIGVAGHASLRLSLEKGST